MTAKRFFATYAWFDLRNSTEFTEAFSAEEVLHELAKYYKIIQKLATKYCGEIIASLGDGIGVLFKEEDTVYNATEMSNESLSQINQSLRMKAGVGIARGPITYLEVPSDSKSFNFINYLYGGSTVIRTFRIGSLAGKIGHDFIISDEVHRELDKKHQKYFKLFDDVELKGLQGKTKLHIRK